MGDVSECNIKVICRVRPLNEAEERAGNQLVVRTQSDDSVSLTVRPLRRLDSRVSVVSLFRSSRGRRAPRRSSGGRRGDSQT